jgi:hypothetical protein
LARWGSQIPTDSTADLSVDALILALKTTFDPRIARDLSGRYELRIDGDTFRAEIDKGRFHVIRGQADHPTPRWRRTLPRFARWSSAADRSQTRYAATRVRGPPSSPLHGGICAERR